MKYSDMAAKMIAAESAGYQHGGINVPEHMIAGINRWILHPIMPGHFLTAVLQNNLRSACERADLENAQRLPAFVAYLQNVAPGNCWGSAEMVADWPDAIYDETRREIRAAYDEHKKQK